MLVFPAVRMGWRSLLPERVNISDKDLRRRLIHVWMGVPRLRHHPVDSRSQFTAIERVSHMRPLVVAGPSHPVPCIRCATPGETKLVSWQARYKRRYFKKAAMRATPSSRACIRHAYEKRTCRSGRCSPKSSPGVMATPADSSRSCAILALSGASAPQSA